MNINICIYIYIYTLLNDDHSWGQNNISVAFSCFIVII